MNRIVEKRRKKPEEAEENCLVKRRKKQEGAQDNYCLVEVVAAQLDDLPESCIYDIFVRLPLESLCVLRLVCKSWRGILKGTNFPNTRGVIFSTPDRNYSSPPKKVFSAKSNSTITDLHLSFHLKFMEFKDGKSTIKEYGSAYGGRITASCDGLIVLEKDSPTRILILLNPVTRELEDIHVGTISSGGDLYGLASFGHASPRRYKLLRLFTKDKSRNLLGCEVLDIGSSSSGSWRAVDVPPTKHYHLLHSPVLAMGALHWLQYVADGHDVECIVSMPLDDEKFKTTPIPSAKTAGGGLVQFNTVFAMGEFLGFSSRSGRSNQIEVWISRGDECGWEKQYNINTSGLGYITTPLLYCGDGQLVFKCEGDKCFYAYNRKTGRTTKVEKICPRATTDCWTIFPHVNSHVSWRRR